MLPFGQVQFGRRPGGLDRLVLSVENRPQVFELALYVIDCRRRTRQTHQRVNVGFTFATSASEIGHVSSKWIWGICAWFMLNDCPDMQDCPLSSLPETVVVASDSWLLRASSSPSLSWRLLWFSDFLFHRQRCSAETQHPHQPQTVLSLWGQTLVYLVVSLLTRVERYQSSLHLLSPTAFHRVIRDSRGGPQTWHDGHFGPGTVRVDLDSMSLQPTAWGSQNSISASTKSPPHPERDKGPQYEEKVSTTWSSQEIIPSINQARDISDISNINRSGSIGIVDPEDSLLWRYCHKQLFHVRLL